jgi:hypothetical protein
MASAPEAQAVDTVEQGPAKAEAQGQVGVDGAGHGHGDGERADPAEAAVERVVTCCSTSAATP